MSWTAPTAYTGRRDAANAMFIPSISVTVGAGDRLLIFAHIVNTTITAPVCNWNTSESCTVLHNENSGSGSTSCKHVTFKLDNPTPGTFNIDISWSTINAIACATVVVIHGSDLGQAPARSSTASATSTSPAVTTVSSVAGELIICGAGVRHSLVTITADEVVSDGQQFRIGEIVSNSSSGSESSHARGWVWWQVSQGANAVIDGTISQMPGSVDPAWRLRALSFSEPSPERRVASVRRAFGAMRTR